MAAKQNPLDKYFEATCIKQIAMLEDWAAKAPPAVAEWQRAEIAKIKKMTPAQYRRHASAS